MTKYTAASGADFSDADIETWANEAEAGFPGARFGTSSPGRPVSVGQDAKPFTLRLDAARRAKLEARAKAEHTNPSQVMRDLIDAM
ncbi:CopG family transcriptional regulator [Isoptericola croceus]|uniref:CopG family transcriptional regulator n=1 Tax=Isoptericola croceus TaxID=3031406 RepID=UPI0023F87161|nr:CopG family transcriptional regulator [Isoptericola croceus]